MKWLKKKINFFFYFLPKLSCRAAVRIRNHVHKNGLLFFLAKDQCLKAKMTTTLKLKLDALPNVDDWTRFLLRQTYFLPTAETFSWVTDFFPELNEDTDIQGIRMEQLFNNVGTEFFTFGIKVALSVDNNRTEMEVAIAESQYGDIMTLAKYERLVQGTLNMWRYVKDHMIINVYEGERQKGLILAHLDVEGSPADVFKYAQSVLQVPFEDVSQDVVYTTPNLIEAV